MSSLNTTQAPSSPNPLNEKPLTPQPSPHRPQPTTAHHTGPSTVDPLRARLGLHGWACTVEPARLGMCGSASNSGPHPPYRWSSTTAHHSRPARSARTVGPHGSACTVGRPSLGPHPPERRTSTTGPHWLPRPVTSPSDLSRWARPLGHVVGRRPPPSVMAVGGGHLGDDGGGSSRRNYVNGGSDQRLPSSLRRRSL